MFEFTCFESVLYFLQTKDNVIEKSKKEIQINQEKNYYLLKCKSLRYYWC